MSDEHIDFTFSEDEDGTKHAVNGHLQVTVLPDGDTRLFHRREMKPFKQPVERKSALVAQLDDVRVFVVGSHIVVTKQNLGL